MAVTGLGAVTALGATVEETWRGVREARCGIGPITLFDTAGYRSRTGGQVRDFDEVGRFGRRVVRRTARVDRFAATAAAEAVSDAGLSDGDLQRAALVLGAGAGGMLEAERYHRALLSGDLRRAKLTWLATHPPNAATDFLARRFAIAGPRATVTTACSSSATALGVACDWIRSGRADLAVCGGAESLCQLTFAGFNALRAVDPDRCRPFDARRAGISLGEGAGIVVLEAYERAEARGARVHAELLGYATSADAFHMTAPEPSGGGAARAFRSALARSGVDPDDVGYVNAHGTGTPQNDSAETAALHAVFGARAGAVPVSSSKSQFGHLLGAAGGIEAVVTVLALREGLLPATVGWESRDPACDLDYVPGTPRDCRVSVAVSSSFAFGGNNTVLVFRA